MNLPGEAKKLPLFDEVKRQLEDYFNGSLRRFSVALRPHGTPFCQSVWNLLEEIAYGKTVAYGELAARLSAETNRKTSARAVEPLSVSIRFRLSFPATVLSEPAANSPVTPAVLNASAAF